MADNDTSKDSENKDNSKVTEVRYREKSFYGIPMSTIHTVVSLTALGIAGAVAIKLIAGNKNKPTQEIISPEELAYMREQIAMLQAPQVPQMQVQQPRLQGGQPYQPENRRYEMSDDYNRIPREAISSHQEQMIRESQIRRIPVRNSGGNGLIGGYYNYNNNNGNGNINGNGQRAINYRQMEIANNNQRQQQIQQQYQYEHPIQQHQQPQQRQPAPQIIESEPEDLIPTKNRSTNQEDVDEEPTELPPATEADWDDY